MLVVLVHPCSDTSRKDRSETFLKELKMELGDLASAFQWTSSSILTERRGKNTRMQG